MSEKLCCLHCAKTIEIGELYFDIDGEPWCNQCVQQSKIIHGKEDENGMDRQ